MRLDLGLALNGGSSLTVSPTSRRGKLGCHGRWKGVEAETRQSGNCSAVKLETLEQKAQGPERPILCRGVLGPGFVSAGRYILPRVGGLHIVGTCMQRLT